MRRLALIAIATAALIACGPKPRVESSRIDPPQQGTAKVTVVVGNSFGEGQVEVKVTLRGPDGAIIGRKNELVAIHANERVPVVLEFDVGDETQLRVDAEVVYPPD